MDRRALFATAALTLAGTAFAQTSTIVTQSFGKAKIERLSNLDTRKFSPQIVRPFIAGGSEKENPTVPTLLAPRPSGLPLGRISAGSEGVVRSQFPSISSTGWVPPDNDLAVGKTKLVTAVNMAFAIHLKDGTLRFQQDGQAFFNDGGNRPVSGDPKVIYDRDSDRFMAIMMQIDGGAQTSHMVLAVSDDGDPEGIWYRYRIDTGLEVQGNKYWLDYPGFGASKQDIVFTGNMFGHTSGFAGNLFVVVPKAPLLTGAPATGEKIHDPFTATTKVAVEGDGDINYCAAVRDSSSLWLIAVRRSPWGGSMTERIAVPIPSFRGPSADVPGPGGTRLDTLDSRFFTLNMRRGQLVTCHNTVGGPGTTARWYQVAHRGWPISGTPAFVQAGDIPVAGFATHMPAAAINDRGDVSVLFSATNAQTTADLLVATREAASPLGSLGVPTIVGTSDGVYDGQRWGDYFGIQVDPTNDNVFWGYGMLGTGGGNWKTEVASWEIRPTPPKFTILGIAVPSNMGRLAAGTLADLDATDGKGVRVNSLLNKGLGNVAALEYSFRFSRQLKPYVRGEAVVLPITNGQITLSMWDAVRARWIDLRTVPANGAKIEFLMSEREARRMVGSNGNARVRLTARTPGNTPYVMTVDSVLVRPTAE